MKKKNCSACFIIVIRSLLTVPLTMNPTDKFAEIRLMTCKDGIKVPIQEATMAEDVCNEIARILRIGPICRHLFSLRFHATKIWLYPSFKMQDAKSTTFDYRLRFKVPKLSRLKQIDLEAFNYYYHQVRRDVIENHVPDITYEKHKGELLGLGVTDMYRVMIDEKISLEQVEADYKKYIPLSLFKNHFLFIKPKIHTHLSKIRISKDQDGWFVKEEYLRMFEHIAPNYLSETYNAEGSEHPKQKIVLLDVNPFHKEEPGIRCRFDGRDEEWKYLCSIENLCYISVRTDATVEICRKNGIPSYFRFTSERVMYSFVSLLDGYYRFSCKWTFNLCKDVYSPSLKRLYMLKCHGPVGGHFSYAKLEEKRSNKPGCFILRESESSYDAYYLDVCIKYLSKPKTYKIEKIKNEDYLFSYNNEHYTSIPALVSAFRNGNDNLELLECLPPSEFDKSRLLICAQEDLKSEKTLVSNPAEYLLSSAPQIIDIKNLQVFKGIKKASRNGRTYHYRSLWIHQKDAKIEASMKILKPEFRDSHLTELLELAGSWACLKSNAIVKLYGVTLKGPVSMVTEYLHHGPFDVYLRENHQFMQTVDLVEAGTYLASALWHLEECGIVHGSIRCRKLLVSAHNENTCLIKLCDPGLHKYNNDEVHWIPPECHHDFTLSRSLPTADIWAFGTTLWEIFSYGSIPDASCDTDYYLRGKRLPLPSKCPIDIYRLMLECWDLDVYRRKKPQAIMRDINQLLYQEFNSRRTHVYATMCSKSVRSDDQHSMTESNTSLGSDATAETFLVTDVPTYDLIPVSDLTSSCSFVDTKLRNLLFRGVGGAYATQAISPDIATMLSHCESNVSSLDSDSFMQGIFELGSDCNVVLQGKIGQGFYGEVFKGILERSDRDPQLVAVKKLKANALSTNRQDLEREILIMKDLKHKNIVEIIGAFHEPDLSLVMEYVQHGSLQTYLKINKETLTPESLLKFALDVACGMDYLGKKNIVHRDLAARNILVASENHVKISDFGLAQMVGQNSYYILKTNRELPIKWYAPESLKDGKFSHRSDVWSYGVTLYEMFSLGEDPKLECCTNDMDQSKLLEALESGARLQCPPTCPQTIYVKLIVPCWKLDSKDRPIFAKIFDTIQKLRRLQDFQ